MKQQKHTLRWQHHLERLREKDLFLGKLRTASFLFILIFVVMGALAIFPGLAFSAAGISLLLFSIFLWVHRKVRYTLGLFESRTIVAIRQKAMAELDWKNMAPAAGDRGAATDFLLKDLNILGERGFFRLIDQTISTGGSDFLLSLFRDQNVTDREIRRRSTLVREILKARGLRLSFLTRVQASFKDKIQSHHLASLLEEKLVEPGALGLFWATCGLQILMLVGLVLSWILIQKALFLVPAFALIYVSIYLRRKIHARRAYGWALSAEASLESLHAAFRQLEQFASTKNPELHQLLTPFGQSTSAATRLRQLDLISGAMGVRQNFILHGILHILMPWDLIWTLVLERYRLRIRTDFRNWLQALAEFEAFLSIAQFAESFPQYVWPELVTGPGSVVEADNLRHPLLPADKAVGNSLILNQTEKCLLITGSNMSGKSTFLRSVGINLLLAKTGGPVAADRFIFQNRPILSSLSGSDSLEDGLSSFYAEVRRLSEMLSHVKSGKPLIFLIDEIFRGTNNRERLIGSQAYMKEIVRCGGVGIVTTHDLELAQLESLGLGIFNAHFKETIHGSEMTFTYRMAEGPCPSSNALKVMELSGLPVK